jgi:TolC family type I secretion outer membrane protein
MSAAPHIPGKSRISAAPARIARGPAAIVARRLGLAGAGLLLFSGFSAAHAQTMTQALAETYNTNPTLLAQRALLRATDEQVPQALSGWRPIVNFTGQVGGARAGFTSSLAGRSASTYTTFFQNSVNLAVTQPIYTGGRTLAQTRQATNTVESTRAQTLEIETTVFQAVAMAYLDVVRDQALVEVDRNNVQVLTKQLEATQDRFRVGEVTRTDVAQAEASLAQGQGTLTTAQGTLAQSRAEYVAAVGHPPGILLLPRERPALPATREETESLAANNNFSVISANFAELAARDNIDVVKSQLLPQVSLVGNVQRLFAPTISLSGSRENEASIVAQMTWAMYEGGTIYSQTRQAQQTVGQRLSQVDAARRIAVQTAVDAWETLKAGRASISSFAAAVRAAQIALQGIQQEALVGTATTLDVLVQNQTLLTTQQQLIVAEHDSALAEFNVAAATGRLTAADLHLPVQLYDMERHFKQVKDKWAGFRGGLSQ